MTPALQSAVRPIAAVLDELDHLVARHTLTPADPQVRARLEALREEVWRRMREEAWGR